MFVETSQEMSLNNLSQLLQEADVPRLMEVFAANLAGATSLLTWKTEEDYHLAMHLMLFSASPEYTCRSELFAGKGRVDIILEPANKQDGVWYIIELKHCKEIFKKKEKECYGPRIQNAMLVLAEEAVDQIYCREYYKGVMGTRCIFIGVCCWMTKLSTIYEERLLTHSIDSIRSNPRLSHNDARTITLLTPDSEKVVKIDVSNDSRLIGLFAGSEGSEEKEGLPRATHRQTASKTRRKEKDRQRGRTMSRR